jgi:hypothetical protein
VWIGIELSSNPSGKIVHAFVGEELDDVPLFEFHYVGTFQPLSELFPS